MYVKWFSSVLIWIADCVKFLSENHLYRCPIFGQVGYFKTKSEPVFGFPHITRSYWFRTSLDLTGYEEAAGQLCNVNFFFSYACHYHNCWTVFTRNSDTAVPAEGNGDLQTLIQTMSHIVESCPLTKLCGSLSRLHSADHDAVSFMLTELIWT